MRPRQFWIYMTIYISTLLLIFLINYSGYKNQVIYETATALSKSLYYQFLVLQVIVLWIWGSFNSASAIRDEVFDKTYDFFRILPLSARTKAAGILAGKNLIVFLFGACNFVLMTGCGIAGGLKPMLQVQIILVIAAVTILTNSVALLFSINSKGKKRRSEIIGFVLLAFFLGPAIINGVLALAGIENIETKQARVYEFEVPVLILASLVAVYFSCWAIKGLLRKFTREDEPMFSRLGALLFMLGYELVVLGFFYHYLINVPQGMFARGINMGFWCVSLLPALMIPLASIRTFDRYLEFAGRLPGSSGRMLRFLRLKFYSNMSLWLLLFTIWAVFAMGTTWLCRLPLIENLVTIAVIFTFYIFALLLLEVYVVVSPNTPKIGVLLAFVLGVYAILPLILAGVLEIEGFVSHSPFGYFVNLLDKPQRQLLTDVRVIAVNLLLCIVPAVVVISRYVNVIKTRQKM